MSLYNLPPQSYQPYTPYQTYMPQQPLPIYNPPPQSAPIYYAPPVYTPPSYVPYYPQQKNVYLNSEGDQATGFVADAYYNKFPLTDAKNQWKNYTVASLDDVSKTSTSSNVNNIYYCNPGITPTYQGGVAGDPEVYKLTGTSNHEGTFHPPSGTAVRVYADNGLVINNFYEDINVTDRKDNVAATESKATIIDPKTGEKHSVLLSDGQTKYIDPKGNVTVFNPNSSTPLIIGDPKDPLAKLEMKSGNSGNVPITLTHYERFDPATLKALQDKGVDPSYAATLRSENEIRWGNRIADGKGATERAAAGTSDPVYLNQYYDLHVVNKGNTWSKTPSPTPDYDYPPPLYNNPYAPPSTGYNTGYSPNYNTDYNSFPIAGDADPYAAVQPNYGYTPPYYNAYDPYQSYNPYPPVYAPPQRYMEPYQAYSSFQTYNPYQAYTPYQPMYSSMPVNYDPYQGYNPYPPVYTAPYDPNTAYQQYPQQYTGYAQ